MSYEIIDGKEYDVIEYPTHAQEQQLHRLFVRTADPIVAQETKECVCEKWGWDAEDVVEEEITDRGTYHLELAKVIFEDADDLSEDDIPNLRPGLIQEAREDFIQGCFGRSEGQGRSLQQALQAIMRSQTDQNETASGPTTPLS